MYIPKYFKINNKDEVRDFLKKNSFGILITSVADRPWGTHIPMELEKDTAGTEVLFGHISKGNPQRKHFKDKTEALAIFNGPHAYVSSSWYNHENVPTWNYTAVHVYGKLVVLDETELMDSLKKLVDKHEAGSESPVKMEEMPEQTLRQMKGIVGFKILIREIHAAFKLSQNRDDEDHQNIIEKLTDRGDSSSAETAAYMQKTKKQQ
ncbi:MAG TPA: FMN-binding negative transcriptional regulator [Balneolaceae bacterium]|nr:FMN-binding negative transcriptional regulator [Balneolaceae bacterium]